MLGDAGANLLGILGFYAVLVLQPIHKIILLFSKLLHLLAEIYRYLYLSGAL